MTKDLIQANFADQIILIKTVSQLRDELNKHRRNGKTIGFVPTMGALHEGHLSLIRIAREKADIVVVSVFVNPTQFGPDEDFESYPRRLDSDLKASEEEGVNIVFAPDRDELYSDNSNFRIKIDSLNDHMCGGSRPGFFEGVVLIVNKLFNIVEPDLAVLGQKDIQQVQIVRRLVKEFNHGVEVISGPIQRANDGLALSSRNAYLSEEERVIAPGLYRALQYIEVQLKAGVHTPELLIDHQKSELEAKGFEIDYLNVFDTKTLKPVETLQAKRTYIIAGAAYLGKTRLIDNILLEL